ncbi:Na+/H+ antiporter subunit G [Alkalilimnicola ehrlichii]|uniref:Na+/H+ antiporter subunit G n=1 Tax=Alkalilimnicola ehrlichii TaxID=351052 RepID=A0A3E0X0I8_9GAMM|nr:monovalent cation/H(+) antiporter subunit G [Alkalilimnicola ehrlichii]RFA30359.1 Na+/H+ antiporter subunit G [Alkalilimnicola ehrlichii]RFA37931.1 Na+/H+ antiporter subunit G [Alkalilimnicola ehrlichii]
MIEFLTGFFLLGGAALMLIAALGLLRMPDLPTRMHASTKAGALGAGMMVAAVAIYFDDGAIIARAIAIVVFIIMTAPIGAHMIGRAGYFVGVPLWEHSIKDELKEQYDREKHTLASKRDDGSAK